MHIAFDVDGVLYDFVSALRRAVMASEDVTDKQYYRAKHHDFGYTTWDFWAQWDMNRDDIDRVIRDAGIDAVFGNPEFVDGRVVDVAVFAMDQGHRVDLITRRWPGDSDGFNSARFDLVRQAFGAAAPDGLIIVEPTEPKISYPFDLIIEDHHPTAMEAWAAGRRAIVFDQPWNREYAPPAVDEGRFHRAVVVNDLEPHLVPDAGEVDA